MKKQAGFTLIELVVVIVILGILAAIAVPKFVDLTGEAETGAVQGVAAAITGGAHINYAKYKAAAGGTTTAVAISDTTNACSGANNSVFANRATLITGSVVLVDSASTNSNEYRVSAPAAGGICSAGATIECTVTSYGGKTATAYVPCTN